MKFYYKSITYLFIVTILGTSCLSRQKDEQVNNLSLITAFKVAINWPDTNPNPNPTQTPDNNPNNRLKVFKNFSGKNYQVLTAGTDLTKDLNNDGQIDALDIPRSVTLNIPQGATIEAAYLYYGGSAFYNESTTAIDDTTDSLTGGSGVLDNETDIKNNEIDIQINEQTYNKLTPLNAGGDSSSLVSWWKLNAKAGTLQKSKLAYYSNRLDLTSKFQNKSGTVNFKINRLQRADFEGNKYVSEYDWYYMPEAINGKGNKANDCASLAVFSIVVVVSLGTTPEKFVQIQEGPSWVWNNDFTTNSMKSYSYLANPLALDVTATHSKVSSNHPYYVYVSTFDGDPAWEISPGQCGHNPYNHNTGQDYTWIKSGSNPANLYFNTYEGMTAPNNGFPFTNRKYGNYQNVTSLGKGYGMNITRFSVENIQNQATTTSLHFEGDSNLSTNPEQEMFAVKYVIFEGTIAVDASVSSTSSSIVSSVSSSSQSQNSSSNLSSSSLSSTASSSVNSSASNSAMADIIKPTVSITNPVENYGYPKMYKASTTKVTGIASDNKALVRVELIIYLLTGTADTVGTLVKTIPLTVFSTNSWEYPLSTAGLTGYKYYRFEATAIDSSGNTSDKAKVRAYIY